MTTSKVTLLGDSRAFDTYFYNSEYDQCYGYDKTFSFLLQNQIPCQQDNETSFIHIPDHFRGGTIGNNILRLALTDPSIVILCNGLWETLISKKMFIDYAVDKINKHDTRSGSTLDITYSSRKLVDLFLDNKLADSPQKYYSQQQQIVSYFARRRRQCIMLNQPIPPISHLNRIHHAGNFRCLPEWGECLDAINKVMDSLHHDYGVRVLDLVQLMEENGGASECLIDQWHYSASFHSHIAQKLGPMISHELSQMNLAPEHISHSFMMHRESEKEKILIYGQGPCAQEWIRNHPKASIEGVFDNGNGNAFFQSIPVIPFDEIEKTASKIVLLLVEEDERLALEKKLLREVPQEKILLYPEELDKSFYQSLRQKD